MISRRISTLIICALALCIGLPLFLIESKKGPEFLDGKAFYGRLVLSCEIEGLNIFINEEQVGLTTKAPQTFILPAAGVYGSADHEVVVRKEANATQEYYFEDRISFSLYVDVQDNPVERIALFGSPPKDKANPPINRAIRLRIKPKFLAQKTGLVQQKRLKHNKAWNMTEDENRVYVLTRAASNLTRKSCNEPVPGEFVEVYDKKTFTFLGERKLVTETDYTFDKLNSIAVDNDTIYIGHRQGHVLRLDKETLAPLSPHIYRKGNRDNISGLLIYDDYLFVFGEGDVIAAFKNKKPIYSLNMRDNYPPNIKQIHDYSGYNRVNSIGIHNGVLYVCNESGFINAYTLADGRFLRQINLIKYEKEYEYVTAANMETTAVYQDRYVYFAEDYDGVWVLDSKTKDLKHIETLFPKETFYSDLLGEEIDNTSATSIYQIFFYGDYLIFSEVNMNENFVYAYDLKDQKIVHTFKGHKGNISALYRDGDMMVGLSTDAWLYRWDLGAVKN